MTGDGETEGPSLEPRGLADAQSQGSQEWLEEQLRRASALIQPALDATAGIQPLSQQRLDDLMKLVCAEIKRLPDLGGLDRAVADLSEVCRMMPVVADAPQGLPDLDEVCRMISVVADAPQGLHDLDEVCPMTAVAVRNLHPLLDPGYGPRLVGMNPSGRFALHWESLARSAQAVASPRAFDDGRSHALVARPAPTWFEDGRPQRPIGAAADLCRPDMRRQPEAQPIDELFFEEPTIGSAADATSVGQELERGSEGMARPAESPRPHGNAERFASQRAQALGACCAVIARFPDEVRFADSGRLNASQVARLAIAHHGHLWGPSAPGRDADAAPLGLEGLTRLLCSYLKALDQV